MDDLEAKLERAESRVAELEQIINNPVLEPFVEAVLNEARHQMDRWAKDHDLGKTPHDWFWTLGYLSQKAARAFDDGDQEKGLHHIVSSAALLATWHRTVTETS